MRDTLKRLWASRSARLVGCVLLWVALFVLLRALGLDADPPRVLPNGGRGQELWAEGAAKAQEARNWALFGRWQTNPADNYQFWRPQSPVWVYSLAGFLKLFGVTTLAHRAHSILVSALGFALVLWYGKKQLGYGAWTLLALLLSCNFYYVMYTRVGLLEPMVNLFATATVLCCYLALSKPLWLVGAVWALVLATFSKMSGLYLLPVVAVTALVAFARSFRAAPRQWLWIALNALCVGVLVGLYVTSKQYQQRVIWVVAHMAYNRDGQTHVDVSRIHLLKIATRLLDGHRWRVSVLALFPVAAGGALLAILSTLFGWLQRRRRFDWDALTLLWLASAFAPLLLTDNTYVRFHLVLFPPMALLGARGFELVAQRLARFSWAPHALLVSVALGVLLLHGSYYTHWWQRRSHDVARTNQQLERLLPHHAVLVGMWAPWLSFDTDAEFYTVRNYFNVSKSALSQLGVTHLLLRPRDLSGSFVRRHFPHAYRHKRLVRRFRVKGAVLSLYALREPLR